MRTKREKIDSLTPDPANVRMHDEANLAAIAASLERFGQQKPIVVDGDGVVVAGNGTLEAARMLGWDEISVVRTSLTGDEARAFAVADNRTAELAEWNIEALAETLAALPDDMPTGFSPHDVERINTLAEHGKTPPPEPPVGELPEDPTTQPGDVWLLGDHKLLCGDCRDESDVLALLGDARVTVAVTSPPYAAQRAYDESAAFQPVPPDEYVKWFEPVAANIAAHLAEDGSWFLNIKEHCEDGQRVLYVKDLTLAHVRRWGWQLIDELIWVHGGTPRGVRRRFKNAWEPIFHFAKGEPKFRPNAVRRVSDREDVDQRGTIKPSNGEAFGSGGISNLQGVPGGATHIRNAVQSKGDALSLPSNALSFGKNRESLGHPAAYPVALPEFFIRAWSDEGDVVLDPFTGSGSTLIAAEKLGRVFRGIEISPAYCDIIVARWEALTGERATREAEVTA